MSTVYNPSIVTNGLVFYYDMYNTQKSWLPQTQTLSNIVNVNNTITLNNLNYTGNTFSFNGSNSYIEVTGSSFVNNISTYTVSFWALRNAENRMPVSTKTTSAFYWYGDNSWKYLHGGTSGEYYYTKPTSIPLGTWGHYCVVYDGLYVNIYRQGIFQGRQSTTGTADWSQGIKIGIWYPNTQAWSGRIDSFCFYNRALLEKEVQENFQALRSRYGI